MDMVDGVDCAPRPSPLAPNLFCRLSGCFRPARRYIYMWFLKRGEGQLSAEGKANKRKA